MTGHWPAPAKPAARIANGGDPDRFAIRGNGKTDPPSSPNGTERRKSRSAKENPPCCARQPERVPMYPIRRTLENTSDRLKVPDRAHVNAGAAGRSRKARHGCPGLQSEGALSPWRDEIRVGSCSLRSSWPGLTRPSTSSCSELCKHVDAREMAAKTGLLRRFAPRNDGEP